MTLWTEKQWQSFKKYQVFHHFIDKNFYPSLGECFEYEFHQKEGENIYTLKSVKMILEKITPLIKDLTYNKTYASPTTSSSTPWKWDEETEYTRLKIPGKYIHQMKHFKSSTGKNVFWVPIVLDDLSKTIKNCHYNKSSKQFDINNEYSNIIAVAGFNSDDYKINTSYIIDIIDSSYLFYILSLIDETLNKSLSELLATQNQTQLGNFKQVLIR
jgi:hypothetical protein